MTTPHRLSFSTSGNAVVTCMALIRAVANVIRSSQLGKINVRIWNVLHRPISRLADGQGIARIGNHPAGDGYDYAGRIARDENRMI